jgi:hypothetical protein
VVFADFEKSSFRCAEASAMAQIADNRQLLRGRQFPLPPLITLGFTSCNAEDTIGPAIASALAQDWQPREIVVVDDASSDGTVGRQYRYQLYGSARDRVQAVGGGRPLGSLKRCRHHQALHSCNHLPLRAG